MLTSLIDKYVRKSPVLSYSPLLTEGSKRDWKGKPADWSDIRKDCPKNSISLYAAHKDDYSQYDNLGFTATCVGGYNVFIDGVQYGSTYASGAKCEITWSTSGITTGDIITTPELLKAHKIWISPTTEGNNITVFKCARVAASGTESQGVLWAHFNISNAISLNSLFFDSGYKNTLVTAVTAKDNKISITSQYSWASGLYLAFSGCTLLEYVPTFNTREETNVSYYQAFNNCKKLTTVNLIQGGNNASSYEMFSGSGINKIKGNFTITPTEKLFRNCQYLTELPNINPTNSANCSDFLTNAISLKDTILDMRTATGLTKIDCHGNSTYFMAGFKGLRVSNEAPFSNATSPQINVSYTGMDRNALVQLFNDLPYNVGYEVVGSPTISGGEVSGFSVNDYLKLNNTSNSTSWEIYTEFIFDYYNGYQGLLSMASPHFQVFISSNTTYTLSLEHKNSVVEPISVNQSMTSGHKYSLNIKHNNGHFQTRLYNITKQELNLEKEFDGTSVSLSGLLRFGITQGGGNYWHSSQDIANTYIKVNDVYWFRGQPAMTKTLSCVGTTGTADLTQDDKDIALNKGWSITIS